MSYFIHIDEVSPGGQSSHYPKSLTDMYEVKEFIGRAGKVRSDEIRVGYLTLKSGASYPAHSHPASEVYIQLSGKVEWIVGTEKKTLNTVTAINIPPHTSHSMRNLSKDEANLIYFWYTSGDNAVLKEDAKLL